MTTVILKETRSQTETLEMLHIWNDYKEIFKTEIQIIMRKN